MPASRPPAQPRQPLGLGHRAPTVTHVRENRVNSNTVNTALVAAVLARFAAAVGAGPHKRVILVLDGAGWHGTTGGLATPEGTRLEFLPPYSPELQPAEHLWPLTKESIGNRHSISECGQSRVAGLLVPLDARGQAFIPDFLIHIA